MMRQPVIKPVLLAVLAAYSLVSEVSAQDKVLKEVRVGGGAVVGAKPVLRDEIVATESFGARDVEKSGATMLTEALDKRPGVAMQVECAICNVRNVVLNNLPGRYTTLLIDGIPIFSSVSTAYGLDSVSLGGLERIDISRGAGASLIAPEALSGAVNIITRRPTENEFKLNAQLGSYGQASTDVFGAKVGERGALTMNYMHNRHDTVDGDGNGVSEYTGFRRNLGGLGFFADDVGGFKVKGRLDLVDEKRMGGAMGRDYDAVKANMAGNSFNWSAGVHGSPNSAGWLDGAGNLIPYNNGRGGMSEIIFTDRSQFVASGTRPLGAGTLRLASGYAKHKQDSFYEGDAYKADQTQYYLEASTQQPWDENLLTLGLSYRYEDLNSLGSAAGTPVAGLDNYVYRTPGLFMQLYRPFLEGKVEMNAALRYDKHNVFGNITSPRLNVLWNHTDHLNSRFAVGRGYRAPTSFFEQDHGILHTTRIDRQITKPETSDNASYTLSFSEDRFAIASSLNWNRIKNMAMLDSGATDAVTGQPITLFTSAQNPVTVKGGDITATYKFTPTLEGTIGLEKFSYQFAPGTLAFARPEERVYLRLDYDSGPWSMLARATWTGSQDLARFYDYANKPRYNFDGTRKLDRSPTYWLLDARVEYKVDKCWSTYVGVDNMLNFKQSNKESMLWVDATGVLDVTHIWGPNRGRFIYGGVKISY